MTLLKKLCTGNALLHFIVCLCFLHMQANVPNMKKKKEVMFSYFQCRYKGIFHCHSKVSHLFQTKCQGSVSMSPQPRFPLTCDQLKEEKKCEHITLCAIRRASLHHSPSNKQNKTKKNIQTCLLNKTGNQAPWSDSLGHKLTEQNFHQVGWPFYAPSESEILLCLYKTHSCHLFLLTWKKFPFLKWNSVCSYMRLTASCNKL